MVAADLGHALDHAAAEVPAPVLRGDQDLHRTQDGRLRSALGEPGFDNGVEAPVGKARHVSVPRGGNGVAHADDFLPLVVPGVEVKLGVVGDHAVEEPIENGIVVHELGPHLRAEPGDVRERAGPLGTSGKLERHLGSEPRTPRGTNGEAAVRRRK
ncbi:MAG TPA: hypothetical protein VLV46_03765 [Gaiellaceae bacterium]|nr:hypothetical protein [Gaiellaceae bacterium]